jgi:nucleoside-diphosphate-sugar epimerase
MPSLDNLSSLQTILGSGGSIGVELAKALPAYTDRIRLVSRNPKKVNPMDELMPADLTKAADIDRAVAGSAIVYVTVGFEYNTKVWQNTWPPFMRQVIDACIRHQARLVFFDNVYMYDPERLSPMTEQTPMRPSSKKGLVRKELVDMIFEAVKDGQLTALIARSADFIGPKNSVLVETVHKNLQNGKKANWFANADKLHNFTFTPDAGKATALLGNTPDAYNQVWHLPTDRTPLTGKDWVELFAKEMNVEPKVQAIPAWLLSVLGVFIPIMREFKEMAY